MFSKKSFLWLVVVSVILLAFNGVALAETFNWRQFEGESIRFLGLRFYYTIIIEEYVHEFEELTGINVEIELYPEDQFRDKILVELAAGSTDIDVFATGTAYEGRKFFTSGWYEPLDKYINDPALTDPNWDPEDFLDAVWEAQVFEETRVAIPINAVTWLLIYREDLFEEHGLSVPETMEEMAEVAEILTNDVYGYVGRGMRTQAPASWAMFLHSFGGSWLTEDREPAINSPEAIASLEFYAYLMNNYANPGAVENHWHDVLSLMQQGHAGQIIDTAAWVGALSDPEASAVHDKVSYARMPEGPGGPVAELWSWNLAISSFSQKKDPAWYFIQWVTGKDMQKTIQLRNFPSARQSAWTSDEFAEIANPAWLNAVLESFEVAQPMAQPPVVAIHEVLDVVGSAIVDTILGITDAESALNRAAAEMKMIMEDTE